MDGKIYRINEEVEVEEGNKIENGEGYVRQCAQSKRRMACLL